MGARGLVFALVMVAVILLGGIGAIGAALDDGGQPTDIEGEEFDPVGNETIELEFSNLDDATYSETVRVTDNQDSVFPRSGNYEWNRNNGTIFVIEGSDLAAENNAFINYSYTEPTGQALLFADLFATLSGFMGWLVFLIVAAIFMVAMRIMGGA